MLLLLFLKEVKHNFIFIIIVIAIVFIIVLVRRWLHLLCILLVPQDLPVLQHPVELHKLLKVCCHLVNLATRNQHLVNLATRNQRVISKRLPGGST